MNKYVTSVYRAVHYFVKTIHRLKTLLTQKTLATVIHAFVIYCIDYYTPPPLCGVSDYDINRLKRNSKLTS